jgi:hypothetical protein
LTFNTIASEGGEREGVVEREDREQEGAVEREGKEERESKSRERLNALSQSLPTI